MEFDLYNRIDKFLEPRAARIESWQDQARMLISFLQLNDHTGPFRCNQPETTGLGTYMYVVEFGRPKQWLVFDAEAGVSGIYTRNKPNPKEWS